MSNQKHKIMVKSSNFATSVLTGNIVICLLVFAVLLSGGALASTRVKADSSDTAVIDQISIMIPAACSLSGTIGEEHTASWQVLIAKIWAPPI